MAKIGRNSPCPCNSGKKYKKCCGFFGSTSKEIDNAKLQQALKMQIENEYANTIRTVIWHIGTKSPIKK